MPDTEKTALALEAQAATGPRTEKYQRILEAAIVVIAEKGFSNSRVSDIAGKAGVADGTIYLYFKNKEQILMAALDSAFHRFLERAKAELAHCPDPAARLRRLAFLHLDSLGANRSLAAVFQTELRQSAKFLAEFSHRNMVEYFDLIRQVIRDGQQAGIFRRDLSEKLAARCFFGALDETVTSWVLSDHDYPLAASADGVVDLLLRGMEPRPLP